ncbi:hypothetical protein RhiirA5_384354 [Rhizophagus irregularis]|uniref:Uncharacterized protein n=1 Tax=Rhizophagus irregularis TaxID=588596 RepID=A0A2N0NTH2_9GLOM|nr:hypothetical protein RhiirA5_384354 [Rhizophagus irregularis]
MSSTPYIEINKSSASQHSYPQLGDPTPPENDSDIILHDTEQPTVLSAEDILSLDINDIYPYTYSALHLEDDDLEETYDDDEEDYFKQLLNTSLNAEIQEKHEPKSDNIPADFINDKSSHANLLYYRWLNDSIPNADDYPFLVPYFAMDSNHKKQIMTKLTQASSSTSPSAPPNNYNPIPDVFIPKKYHDIIPKDPIYVNNRYVIPGSREWFTYMYNVDESYYPPESSTPCYNAKGKYVARTPIYRSGVVENFVPSHIVEKFQLRRLEKLKEDALIKEAAYYGTTSKHYNARANTIKSITDASYYFHERTPGYLAKRQQNHNFSFSNATLDKNHNKALKKNNLRTQGAIRFPTHRYIDVLDDTAEVEY